MSKVIPEIYISNADQTGSVESMEACPEGLSDNEILEVQSQDCVGVGTSCYRDDLLTDIELSSVEDEVIPCQSIERFSSEINTGESSEKLINVHSPGKTQKSFIYFLKTAEARVVEDCLTDYEGISASEDDEESPLSFSQLKLSSTSDEKTCIKDQFLTEPNISSSVTPESTNYDSKGCLVHNPTQSFTDTEFIYSNNDASFKLRASKGKSFVDGFLTDAEDSDNSLIDNPFIYPRKTSLEHSRMSSSKLNVNIKKKSEPILTDVEYIDDIKVKEKSKICKPVKVKYIPVGKKLKHTQVVKKDSEKKQAVKSKLLNENYSDHFSFRSENENNTDSEEFQNEDTESDTDIQTAAYVPETKREIIISNQNIKGDIALILPINKSSQMMTEMELNECGYSDVEELQDYITEDMTMFFPSPEPPLSESSFVQTSESFKDKCKLKAEKVTHEPLTDTEEINIVKKLKPKKTKIKVQNKSCLLKTEEVIDNLTDMEDLILDKTYENRHTTTVGSSLINTDVEDLSDDGINEENYYPEYGIVSSCNSVTAKENIGPFSHDTRLKMNKANFIPQFKTTSPSPVPYNTEMEDISGEEDPIPSMPLNECNIEPHISTVHIRHSRMFKPKTDELKDFFQQPDPLTDIEEIEYNEVENNMIKFKNECKETVKTPTTKPAVIEDTEIIKMENERCESAYENLGRFYREIKGGSLYPPQLGYSEFTTSTSSLGFETETFSELFFSSSSSSEEEDIAMDFLLGPETPGILYKISKQLDKVPRYISTRKNSEERADFLDMSEEAEDLISLQDSVENMINKVSNEEKLFLSNKSNYAAPVKINLSNCNKNKLLQKYDDSDPVDSLNLIENQISTLIMEVEREEKEIIKTVKNKNASLILNPGYETYKDIYSSSSDSSDEFDIPQICLKVGNKLGSSTIDISTIGGSLKRCHTNRSLPNISNEFSFPSYDSFQNEKGYPSSSIEYITPMKGVGFINSGYCIWTSDDDLLEEGSLAPTVEAKPSALGTEVIHQNGFTTEKEIRTDLSQTVDGVKQTVSTHIIDYSIPKNLNIIKTDIISEEDSTAEIINIEQDSTKYTECIPSINENHATIQQEKSHISQIKKTPIEHTKEYKYAIEKEMKGMEYASSIDDGNTHIQSKDDVDRIIKQMEFQLINSKMLSEETETDTDDSPKPIITTPSMSRRGIGGSQRLSQEERPTVRIVTDFAEDSTEEEEETSYYVTEPIDKPKRRNVKFRFDSGDYRDDEESDKEIEEKIKAAKVEKKFERMASETKESELEKSDGEFQRMISQLSVEEMDEALNLWDKGGLTPSDLDSKSLTEPSDETSPQEGTQALEEEEPKEAPPPIPSPRSQSIPSEPSQEPEELQNYVSKKIFWEQVSTGIVEKQQESVSEKPPVPKPRLSITASIEKPDYYETSPKGELLEIDKKCILPEATPTDAVASGISKEESLDDSEVEYIQTHKDELSYDNDAFDLDDTVESLGIFSTKKRPGFERSVSLPCDTSTDSSVRTKKRMFEAQIKKEMVVEQLMSQLDEESSPEHKCIEQMSEKPVTDTQAMVTRQIHTEIFSDELEQQIDSLVPENKELRQHILYKEKDDTEITVAETSSPDTSISSSVAEILQYKNDIISKPSDSLEVHVDKSETEGTEKELDEDLKVLEDSKLQTPFPKEKEKIGSVTSSQGESEDTFSESDVTPEDTRFKEQQDIQEWASQELKSDKKTRSIYTPEEHLPDTVWEVPVQESVESLHEETVQQLPSNLLLNVKKKPITESEARELAKVIVEDIEVEICKIEATLFDTKHKTKEKDFPELKRPGGPLNIKFSRTDTTTSSMEITDEDLRSSGVESDISPLESQACQVFKDDLSEGDSSDDVDNIDLSKETPGEDVLERTLAEVKESLEAVKEELIEERKKKKDSITKESPSEFEFKVLSLENRFNESIKESHYEEGAVTAEAEKPTEIAYKAVFTDKDSYEKSFSSDMKSEVSVKHDKDHVSILKSKEERSDQEQGFKSLETVIKEEGKEIVQGQSVLRESCAIGLKKEEQSISNTYKFEEVKVLSGDSTSTKSKLIEESEKKAKCSESYEYDTLSEAKDEYMKVQQFEHKEDKKTDEEECKKKTDIHSSEFISADGRVVMKTTEKNEISSLIKTETKHYTETCTIEEVHHMLSGFTTDDKVDDSEQKEDSSSELAKSPIQDDLSTSSSEVKISSDTSVGIEKPSIIIRKHSKSTISKLQDVQSDPYSSSGESHYHSFEQTSDSLRSPSSRPLSSDVEGLVTNLVGITGSSEYESAVSGQSTTATSHDYQTAVSSLSSRDSMKSLDSESSGNLASVEISSEASETLVPSAMELEEMESKTPLPHYRVESPLKIQSISESNGQSVSFDISTEEISEDEVEIPAQELTQRMKRSHEMTFQPEPRPIAEESSIVGDVGSIVSDSAAMRTVVEVSRTESDKMDGSATSDQLTVSGTSEQLSFSESKDTESTKETKIGAFSSQLNSEEIRELEYIKMTSSIAEQSVQNICTDVASKSTVHSNGPTQVEYNVEYDEVESEVKKRPGHRRNGSTSFRASMIPVFQGYEFGKKTEDILEDSAESDKYTQNLTPKEGSQEEKKDIDEAEKLEDEFYQTEADQGFHRDVREGRVIMKETYECEEIKELETKSRLSSVTFSEDRPDSELAELLKQCSTDATEDPIERPKTPEPIEECEIKDDTPEFSSEAQASVTELEMEYSGAFSRSCEYEAHVSPIREKGLLWHEEAELAEAEAAFHEPHFSSLHEIIHEDPFAEKHELETQELSLKEEVLDRTSPVPGITVTQHMTPVLDESFVFPDADECTESAKQTTESVSSRASSEASLAGKEYILESATTKSILSDDFIDETSHTTDEKTVLEKNTSKEIESASDSPTSDSFELLEKPDLADEFVIIEEVGKEAEEQDDEGKSVKILGKRISHTHRLPEKEIVSPPTTSTKMTKIKYYTKGGEEEEPFEFESGTPPKDKAEESSQEGSPPSATDDDFKPEVEAGKKWMEMQFQGVEPIAPIYGYDMEFERGHHLEDIKEEDLNDLESSSKIGSMGSQVSHSIGSFGSVKESLSSTPDYDILAGRKFFTRSGEHDDVSMSSLQEFERLENLIALESTKHKSLGSQDSLTSSSNSKKHGSRSGGDDISLASLKEFEGLESACIAAERIERKARAEEESLLSEIEEGHESQASESESCVTVSVSGVNRDSDEDDYEKRMFEIDEIIRQAQTNVEQFMDAKSKEMEKKIKSESLGHADSLEEMTKVPDLDFDQPIAHSKTYCGKTYITQWEDLGEELLTSTDSLELKTQISKASLADPFTTSTDSLEIKFSQDVMSVSTDSIEAAQKKKTIMTDSIEIGEKSSMITSTDSLEEKITQANSLDEEEQQPYSNSSGKEVDWSGSVKEESYEEAINRMPPPRAECMLGSTDSLEPTSSTATHATYQYETDSVMSSSFTSADSTTMVDDDGIEARAGVWFEEGKPYVTEVIEPGDDEFSQIIHRTVEMPPQVTKVSFKGQDAEKALREYIEKFDPGEDISETRDVDSSGNVHIKRVIQKRIVLRPEEMGGNTTELKGEELEKYLTSLTHSQFPDHSSPKSTETHAQYSPQWTVSQSQGERIKSEQEEKQITDSHRRGGRPSLKYDISLDEEPEFDPREHDWRFNLHTHLEHDEDHSDEPDGYSMEQKGPSQPEPSKK